MQKPVPREKVVQIYEKLFAGQDITSGRAGFWDEFFLLRVNIKALLSYFDKLSHDSIVNLKPHLNRLYEECISNSFKTNHWQRVANALQTADCLMLGSFQAKNVTLPPEDRLQLLISNEYSPSANADYTELYSASFINDWPPLLQELVINSLTIHCVLMDNVTDNPIFEWLVDESLFELLGTLISNPCLRRRFGVGACRLLGLISQYQWKEYSSVLPKTVQLEFQSGKEDWGRLVGSCEDVERDPSDSTCHEIRIGSLL
ncbi:unnamed protein product [Mesocestoides corti]|uniref:Uncharacterized protein n=1 Tax=Mesocestoides corti TaxID=53468 RepID=A0A0R3UCQ2_MESCO|nr:unnamed protein product [Mesocestoides corti]